MLVETRSATKGFTPAYLRLYQTGKLAERVDSALAALQCREVCPRNCRVSRLEDRFAVCKIGRHAVVASYFPHFGVLSARVERVRHDLLLRLQLAMRFLPEL
jgi:uncharacterized Fe-S radical SAM superfamily protein PflX